MRNFYRNRLLKAICMIKINCIEIHDFLQIVDKLFHKAVPPFLISDLIILYQRKICMPNEKKKQPNFEERGEGTCSRLMKRKKKSSV